jgi:Protein of unknown function (DUF2924)
MGARSDPGTVQSAIDRLADLPLDELKARFRQLKGVPLPKFMRRGLMTQAVAHAIREAAFGGLDRETQRRLDQLVRQIVPAGEKPPPAVVRRIKAGTRLLREWQGRVHEVMVAREGFVWQGATYRSLSQIARHITGTRWNGWVFFGLKKTGAGPIQPTSQPRRERTIRCPPSLPAAASSRGGEAAHG